MVDLNCSQCGVGFRVDAVLADGGTMTVSCPHCEERFIVRHRKGEEVLEDGEERLGDKASGQEEVQGVGPAGYLYQSKQWRDKFLAGVYRSKVERGEKLILTLDDYAEYQSLQPNFRVGYRKCLIDVELAMMSELEARTPFLKPKCVYGICARVLKRVRGRESGAQRR